MKIAKVSAFFDTRRKKKNNKYPVKISVNFKGKKKRYGTAIDLTPDEWNIINTQLIGSPTFQAISDRLNNLIDDASDVINNLYKFSFPEFESHFLGRGKNRIKGTLSDLFEQHIAELTAHGQFDLAATCKQTLGLLNNFQINAYLNQVNTQFLEEFEKFVMEICSTGNKTVIRNHLRNIKSFIIDLVTKGYLSEEKCPFNALFELFEIYIQDLKIEERFGTAATFRWTLNMLKTVKSDMRLKHITSEFLKELESRLRAKKNSDATIGMHFRNIRVVVNIAIKKNCYHLTNIPLKDMSYQPARILKRHWTMKRFRNY